MLAGEGGVFEGKVAGGEREGEGEGMRMEIIKI